MSETLSIRNLTSGYGGAIVLDDVSLGVGTGRISALIGRNGVGKSTLLKTVMGFLPARRGSVTVGGEEVTRVAPNRRAEQGIAYAPQEKALFQDLSVRDNLRLGIRSDAEFDRRFVAAEEAFPFLASRFHQRAGSLSGGEQKMLIVARGIMAEPRLFMLDEVTEGLQPSVIERLGTVLRSLRDRTGVSILLVEQHLPFVMSVADDFAVMKGGQVAASGPMGPEAQGAIEEAMRF
ncbi:ABC transporter ATP-binding protein [Aureimonas sp. SK2]|uniref:ABC transporter ATP-binding protein n=1 Tax=Aureimonas sp. SK2 TaxID=3015992 RepID=UPI0024445F97|nr:ABC transporter ATP-binding protein [Aureimonas sp. SK2]